VFKNLRNRDSTKVLKVFFIT